MMLSIRTNILFVIYKFSKEMIKVFFDVSKNVKFSYKNLLKKEYFTQIFQEKENMLSRIFQHIFAGLFFCCCGVVLSVYYYVFADGRISFLGPVIILLISVFLDKTVGKYPLFYIGVLLFIRVLLFLPLLLIKLYSLSIDKICRFNRK